jgi:hypothetical protein
MLTKDVCLILKSCLGFMQSMNLHIDTLFQAVSVLAEGKISPQSKATFEASAKHLRANIDQVQAILDRIVEGKETDAEDLLRSIPKSMN